MIDSNYRTPYQTFIIDPLLPNLMRNNISPHACTLGALLTGVAILPALAAGYPFFAFTLLLMSGFLDTIDGSLARASKQECPKGAVIDIVSDRIVEIAIILGLYFFDKETRSLPCLLMLSSAFFCVTTFLVVGLFIENNGHKSFYYSPGIMERAEAFIVFGLMILVPTLFLPLAIIFISLVTLTAVIRVYQFWINE